MPSRWPRRCASRHHRTVPLDTDDDRCPACGGEVEIALVGVVTIDDRTESVDSGMCSTCDIVAATFFALAAYIITSPSAASSAIKGQTAPLSGLSWRCSRWRSCLPVPGVVPGRGARRRVRMGVGRPAGGAGDAPSDSLRGLGDVAEKPVSMMATRTDGESVPSLVLPYDYWRHASTMRSSYGGSTARSNQRRPADP